MTVIHVIIIIFNIIFNYEVSLCACFDYEQLLSNERLILIGQHNSLIRWRRKSDSMAWSSPSHESIVTHILGGDYNLLEPFNFVMAQKESYYWSFYTNGDVSNTVETSRDFYATARFIINSRERRRKEGNEMK